MASCRIIIVLRRHAYKTLFLYIHTCTHLKVYKVELATTFGQFIAQFLSHDFTLISSLMLKIEQ